MNEPTHLLRTRELYKKKDSDRLALDMLVKRQCLSIKRKNRTCPEHDRLTMTVICALVGHGLMAILNFEQLSKKSEFQCATLCISDNWKNVLPYVGQEKCWTRKDG